MQGPETCRHKMHLGILGPKSGPFNPARFMPGRDTYPLQGITRRPVDAGIDRRALLALACRGNEDRDGMRPPRQFKTAAFPRRETIGKTRSRTTCSEERRGAGNREKKTFCARLSWRGHSSFV
jgi:hypothetical protein